MYTDRVIRAAGLSQQDAFWQRAQNSHALWATTITIITTTSTTNCLLMAIFLRAFTKEPAPIKESTSKYACASHKIKVNALLRRGCGNGPSDMEKSEPPDRILDIEY